MVQVLEAGTNFGGDLGKAVGSGVGAFGKELGERYAQRKENEALKKLGVDVPMGLTPETRQMVVAEKLRRGLLLKQGAESIPQELRKGDAQNQVQGQPQSNRNIPNQSSSPTQQVSNVPAQQPILTAEQMKQKAEQRTTAKINNGVEANFNDELNELRRENQDNLNYRAVQEAAGSLSDDALSNVMKKPTDEQLGIFNKKAEEYALQGISPGEMKRKLAVDAKNFKNAISRVEKGIEPNRIGSKISKTLAGTGIESDRAVQSMRLKVKPLLDMGLYDTARNLLSEKGYAPEERERIVANLGETATRALADYPAAKTTHGYQGAPFPTKMATPIAPGSPEAEKFQSTVKDVLTKDPATNLILLRKGFMDKGVDWRTFLYTMNDMIENKEFSPNEDQLKALETLDEPPLNNLDKILFELDLIGK